MIAQVLLVESARREKADHGDDREPERDVRGQMTGDVEPRELQRTRHAAIGSELKGDDRDGEADDRQSRA